jgi:hypothetical protein
VNTKRDWLICGHVALDKFNVSRQIVARLDRLRTQINKMAAQLARL